MGGRPAQRLLARVLKHLICLAWIVLGTASVGKELWLVHQVVLNCGTQERDNKLDSISLKLAWSGVEEERLAIREAIADLVDLLRLLASLDGTT